MKKKKIIILVIVILVILGIIATTMKIIQNKKEKEQKLVKIYENLESSDMYLFEMQQNDSNKITMAKKGDKTIIDQYSNDTHTTTLVKEGNTYLILHDRKEYYVYEKNNVEQSILTDGIKEVKDKPYETGTEKVKGKKYFYEEYTGSTMFMLSNTLELNENEVKTRFYFDNNKNLVYIKTIYEENQELVKIKIEKEVSDSIFEIPVDYAEN